MRKCFQGKFMFNELVKRKAALKIASASNYSRKGRNTLDSFAKFYFVLVWTTTELRSCRNTAKDYVWLLFTYLNSIYCLLLQYLTKTCLHNHLPPNRIHTKCNYIYLEECMGFLALTGLTDVNWVRMPPNLITTKIVCAYSIDQKKTLDYSWASDTDECHSWQPKSFSQLKYPYIYCLECCVETWSMGLWGCNSGIQNLKEEMNF